MNNYFLTLLLSALCVNLNSQITWDGGASTTNWNDATNWSSDAVPTAADNVLLDFSGGTVITISVAALAKTVEVKNACSLTVMAGASLTIDAASDDDALETSPSGIIVNNGIITITNTSAVKDGIYNRGTFTNNGTISIDGGKHGISLASGSFTNGATGTISVTNVLDDYVNCDDSIVTGTPSTFTNDGMLTLTITTGDDGIYVTDGSAFVNNNTVTMTGAGGDMRVFIHDPNSTFTNNAGGMVTITESVDFCIQIDGDNIAPNTILNNSGIITLNNTYDDGIKIKQGGILNNNAGGSLILNSAGDAGIQLDYITSTLNNYGTIVINSAMDDAIVSYGAINNGGTINVTTPIDKGISIYDPCVFTNMASGVLNVSGCNGYSIEIDGLGAIMNNSGIVNVNGGTTDGFRIEAQGILTNNAGGVITCDINGRSGIQIYDNSVFTNMASGILNVSGSNSYGIEIDGLGAIMNNSGIVNVNGGTTDGFRIEGQGILTNNAGGVITCDMNGSSGIQIDDSSVFFNFAKVDNSGIINVTNSTGHGIEVFGVFNNLAGGSILGDNSGDDGLRLRNLGSVNNDGIFKMDNSSSRDIETDDLFFTNTANASYWPGTSPGDLKIEDNFDFGPSCIQFEINGTSSTTDYDQIKPSGGTVTISNAKADLVWGFSPAVNDCFTIVNGSSTTSSPLVGTFASVTSSDPSITYTVDYTADGGRDVIVCVTAIVPVEIIYFSGQKTKRGAALSWATASEINNEIFDIERSNDGLNWTKIGDVKGKGESDTLEEYGYLDASPSRGANYYRLKQNDYDGKYEYSNIVVLSFEAPKKEFSVFPNPVDDILYIDNIGSEDLELELYDTNGTLIWSKEGAINQISFENYEEGVYFLNLVNAQKKTVYKIINN